MECVEEHREVVMIGANELTGDAGIEEAGQ